MPTTTALRSGNSSVSWASGVSTTGQFSSRVDADHHHLAVGEADEIRGAGRSQPPEHHLAHLHLGRDDHVDRQVLGREQVRPVRLEIGLRADPGDLGRHVEERMRHLAGDHVDLVVQGHGDDHVGLVDAGLDENVGMGAMADQAAHVERVADRLDQLGRRIDDRYVVLLGRELLGNAEADLPGPADHHPHAHPRPPGPPALADAQRLQLPMQCGALHADEFGRARDVAAEAIDLGAKVLALEDLAGVAERHRHQVLAPCPARRRRQHLPDLGRQHFGRYRLGGVAAGEDQEALDVVAELAEVAGPVMRLEHRQRVVGDRPRAAGRSISI